MDWEEATKLRLFQLNEMDEFRYQAYESTTLDKERMKQYHDKKILKLEFYKDDPVLLFNSRLKLLPSKLKSRWSSPFEVVSVSPYGSIELKSGDGTRTFKVNGQRVKHYHGMVDDELDIDDAFPDERVLDVSMEVAPWYADIANYLVTGLVPEEIKAYQKKKFL
ncbi:uncharacterized protein LOC132061460 [Lycium ferocissimum]|uniref:uncharacterized protein LOC132061460 n=1 Tax=Lycium ferocissimum TaxID=112874 RepID=UPI002816380F|nr:uncharacterized protein LOC132061460 [Lycium ferocissimum]